MYYNNVADLLKKPYNNVADLSKMPLSESQKWNSYTLFIYKVNRTMAMQTIRFLVLATAIAALIAGLNVGQVAHAQSKGTCTVGSNAAGNPTSNTKSGNPHCFDPEQQPMGTTATPAQSGPPPPPPTGTGACASGMSLCNHPQSTNPQGKIVANPHEEPSSGCQGVKSCHTNPQGSLVGKPHYPTR